MTTDQRTIWRYSRQEIIREAKERIHLYEWFVPGDNVPRKAIEAAEGFLAGRVAERELGKAAKNCWGSLNFVGVMLIPEAERNNKPRLAEAGIKAWWAAWWAVHTCSLPFLRRGIDGNTV